ncbi:MAG: glycosyltransferase family 39 protein, partial [Actinomycetota bacterium]|nr:glycosyltransferase family 39 protein [Actinomycetota bacterium]
MAGLVAGSLALRFEQLGTALWGDEGISIGIASHPLGDLADVLARDGSPPLYYVLLRGWMGVVGRSETQTHALSLILALATIPLGLWAGWSLFGRRVGWTLAVLAATNPFLTEYSGETRMYTLVALLALVATASFVHGFAFDRRRYLPLFFGSLLLLLYTHYWGLYFAVAAALGLVPCFFASDDRRRLLRDACLGFAAVALFYLPWLPTFLEQQRHTGAPWSWAPAPREALSALAYALGDRRERVLVALVLTAGVALVPLVRAIRGREGAAVAGIALLGSLPLAAGWMVSQMKPNWAQRYLAIVLPPLLLLAALGIVRSKVPGIVALVIILLIWVQPLDRLTGARPAIDPEGQSPDRRLASVVRPHLTPGDVVVAMQMEEVPVLRYYLGPRFQFADPTGPVRDPQLVDWR